MATPDLHIAGNDPNTATGGQFSHGYLSLTGQTGFSASTPDSAALSITGDLDIRWYGSLDDWTPAGLTSFVAKGLSVGLPASWSYQFAASSTSTGTLRLSLSDGSAVTSVLSSAATGFADGTAHWVRVTWRQGDGRVQFFTSDDGATWTQLGTDQSIAIAAIADSTTAVQFGVRNTGDLLTGRVNRVQIRNGINGTIAFDANFTAQPTGTTSFTESSANAATVTVNGAIAADSGAGARDGSIVGGVTLDGQKLTLNGTTGYVLVPAWTYASSFTWSARVKPTSITGTAQTILSNTAATNGALLRVDATTGKFGVQGYNGATAQTALASSTAASTSAERHVAFTYDGTNGRLYVDGVLEAGPTAMTISASTLNTIIGADNPTTPTRFLGGTLRNVRVDPSALSAGEVLALYRGSTTRPVGHLRHIHVPHLSHVFGG